MLFFNKTISRSNNKSISILNLKRVVSFSWLSISFDSNTLSNFLYLSFSRNFSISRASYPFKSVIVRSFFYISLVYKYFVVNLNLVKSLYYPYNTLTILRDLEKYNYGMIVSQKYYTMLTKSEYILPLSNIFLKNQSINATSVMDLCITDYPSREKRFELLYCFLSMNSNTRFFLKTFLSEFESVESISQLYRSADWLEREA